MLNSQCSILIRSGCSIAKTCGRFSFRMRIEHWELNIGQILPSPHSAQVIFALALSFTPQVSSTPPFFITTRRVRWAHPDLPNSSAPRFHAFGGALAVMLSSGQH